MLVRDANNRIESINYEIEYWLSMKELKEKYYLNDKQLNKKEYNETIKEIDENMDRLYDERKELKKFIDNRLKDTKLYCKLLREIIHYKEELPKVYTWKEIANKVHYSEIYCKILYGRYKKQRNI